METMRTVNIMGEDYTIEVLKYDESELFSRDNLIGWHDGDLKDIVVLDMSTHPVFVKDKVSQEKCRNKEKAVLRHEIIHAFLYESGLDCSSFTYNDAWALNEEMIDFFALQMPKIVKVFEELECL